MGQTSLAATRRTLALASGESAAYYSLPALAELGFGDPSRLPYSVRVLLESALRHQDHPAVEPHHVEALLAWGRGDPDAEVPFIPGRVILQDFTGVPCVVDLAALRSAMAAAGKDPKKIEPLVPVDLVIDHSVQVDFAGSAQALGQNIRLEFERNRERYEFLRWGQAAFETLSIIPPAVGIVHQVNLEYFARGVLRNKEGVLYPDSLVGTDSHTTMINGLGIVGWGVGGIEAEACMLGQPIYIKMPQVVGVRLTGALREGVTATDLTLTLVQMLRKFGVVEKFVEFFGPGLDVLPLADRATIANMAPEYGATIGFFPVDAEAIKYLQNTGRSAEVLDEVERYYRAQGMFRTADSAEPQFTDVLELDMSTVEPSLAGPKRPHDRVSLSKVKESFLAALAAPLDKDGFGVPADQLGAGAPVAGSGETLRHGSVTIAAITSCTNTSNPSVMVGAGLVAKKAVARGLHMPAYVKTSLAPGSRVVNEYLAKAGLLEPLNALRFNIVGYGCTTCIGNSGPLDEPVVDAINGGNLVAAAVLSGNRNFEGRVSPHTRANYLASPPLVVAYALAGRVDIDFEREPIGTGSDGQPVYLRDIWPSGAEVAQAMTAASDPALYRQEYGNVAQSNPDWNAIPVDTGSAVYNWRADSTYIQQPPFFEQFPQQPSAIAPVWNARALLMLGDFVTTDHISPAGNIAANSPAARYLLEHGVQKADWNSYGSRRGNDRVMTRGTFANIRLKNALVAPREGGWTKYLPTDEEMSVYDAAMRYKADGTPLIVLAGKLYGAGSSRDWAAKGTYLLGVRAVLAESFERIHRSNLIGMGVLPLRFKEGDSAASLGLKGDEVFSLPDLADDLKPGQTLTLRVQAADGALREVPVVAGIDTPIEVEYYRHGGILNYVLRQFMAAA
ncbi:MAG: aconitate hydratase AcnA [Immundisolibacter sp.]|uniref:aconitate hydratase AcnA n=1 Tax=Immundisolibacter sp. TaxID=1934948 RepID=UPI00199C5C96|nr:aconitate hydratase AcnA [Immundisolibacter sp.]MBC7162037.1 aconitate hydratase AcnA [Immundisolibacter sp.]